MLRIKSVSSTKCISKMNSYYWHSIFLLSYWIRLKQNWTYSKTDETRQNFFGFCYLLKHFKSSTIIMRVFLSQYYFTYFLFGLSHILIKIICGKHWKHFRKTLKKTSYLNISIIDLIWPCQDNNVNIRSLILRLCSAISI